jgi:hypothetical protein
MWYYRDREAPIATFHSSDSLNLGCLFEWTMLIAILANFLHTAVTELADWPNPAGNSSAASNDPAEGLLVTGGAAGGAGGGAR